MHRLDPALVRAALRGDISARGYLRAQTESPARFDELLDALFAAAFAQIGETLARMGVAKQALGNMPADDPISRTEGRVLAWAGEKLATGDDLEDEAKRIEALAATHKARG